MRTAQELYSLSEAANDASRYEHAVKLAAEAIAIDPQYALAYGTLSRGLNRLGRCEEAIEAARNAIDLDPENEWYFRLLGCIYSDLEQYEEAEEHLSVALKLDPENANSHQRLGTAFIGLGQTKDAVRSSLRALEFEPENELALLDLSWCYIRLGRFGTAEEYCRQILAINPNNSLALNNLGVCLEESNQPEEAAVAYKSSVIAAPTGRLAKSNIQELMSRRQTQTWFFAPLILIALALIFLIDGGLDGRAMPLRIGAAVVIVAVSATEWISRRRRLRRLTEKDPELMSLYRRVQKHG